MKISLCNEVLREMKFVDQCLYAARLGYDGLEVAPFTLSDRPHRIPASKCAQIRRQAEDSGIQITGLHWLLLTPEGFSITSEDRSVRQKTGDFIRRLIQLCAELGGSVLIHGSPGQRLVQEGDSRQKAFERAKALFASVIGEAEDCGVTYCIEPLTKKETNFINNLSEASELVEAVGSPAFRSMLDTKAAAGAEVEPIPDLIDRWFSTGLIAHVHLNDPNLRGPGQGEMLFQPVLRKLFQHRYQGVVAVEPFDYVPDGPGASARAIGYIRGILEGFGQTRQRGGYSQ